MRVAQACNGITVPRARPCPCVRAPCLHAVSRTRARPLGASCTRKRPASARTLVMADPCLNMRSHKCATKPLMTMPARGACRNHPVHALSPPTWALSQPGNLYFAGLCVGTPLYVSCFTCYITPPCAAICNSTGLCPQARAHAGQCRRVLQHSMRRCLHARPGRLNAGMICQLAI